jgi:phosphoribosylaminoimidazolecarboxamide formyltransferase/IMP cyclohydrolase
MEPNFKSKNGNMVIDVTKKIERALVSVSDKTGIVDFAKSLTRMGIEIISTGGTSKLLKENNVTVTEISDYTGFPEILDGRVKTLHPKIHAGLLYRRERPEDEKTIRNLGVKPIDMVVVNLYPFEKATSQSDDVQNAIENLDIGGPTMIRSAAKNYRSVVIVTDPSDYQKLTEELEQSGGTISEPTRFKLMLKAFERTASYDVAIHSFFQERAKEQLLDSEWPAPKRLLMSFEKIQDLRYGENPHQKAAVYKDSTSKTCIATAKQVAGEKELSFTNILDADAAYRLISQFKEEHATVIIKHTNPCGVAKASTLAESCRLALRTDPVSAFGGVYAFTKPVNLDTASLLEDKFVELILAPGFEPDALKLLSSKKNRRILDFSEFWNYSTERNVQKDFKRVLGGILYQDRDQITIDESKLKVVTRHTPTKSERETLLFAWKIVTNVKSNAIVFCSNNQLLGVGAGQMSRVDSCKIAIVKAQEAGMPLQGSMMASDAFFPFRDSVDLAGKAKVTGIIQPGGSMRDEEVIRAADEYDMIMLFTGIRHFLH